MAHNDVNLTRGEIMALETIEFKIKVAWWHKLLLPVLAVQLYFGKEIWIPSNMIKRDLPK